MRDGRVILQQKVRQGIRPGDLDQVARARDRGKGVIRYVAQRGLLPVHAQRRVVDGPEDAGLGIVCRQIDIEGVGCSGRKGVDVRGTGDDRRVISFGCGAAGVWRGDAALCGKGGGGGAGVGEDGGWVRVVGLAAG